MTVEKFKEAARNIEDKIVSGVNVVREEGFIDNFKTKVMNVVNKGKEFVNEIDEYDRKEKTEDGHEIVDQFHLESKTNENGEEEDKSVILINVKDVDSTIIRQVEIMNDKKKNDPFADDSEY